MKLYLIWSNVEKANVQITFETGRSYNTNIWIDFHTDRVSI